MPWSILTTGPPLRSSLFAPSSSLIALPGSPSSPSPCPSRSRPASRTAALPCVRRCTAREFPEHLGLVQRAVDGPLAAARAAFPSIRPQSSYDWRSPLSAGPEAIGRIACVLGGGAARRLVCSARSTSTRRAELVQPCILSATTTSYRLTTPSGHSRAALSPAPRRTQRTRQRAS